MGAEVTSFLPLPPPRLVAARWRTFRLPMRHRFEAAHGALGEREGLLLELVGADGLRGLGEASPMASIGGGTLSDALAVLEAHEGALWDDDPLGALPDAGPGVAAVRCAIDVALLDLEGRRRGVPIARLLGAAPVADVEVNAIIGVGAPSEVAAWGLEAVAAGYRVLKLKVGVGSIADDVARVSALRGACPHARVRLDANGAWDEATARTALAALVPFDVELLEQPVAAADVDALARLHSESGIALGADEVLRDAAPRAAVVAQSAADLLVLKPMVLGGLRPALELARRGAAAGMGAFATTTFDSSVGTAAALHLAAALPQRVAHGLGTGAHLGGDLVRATLLPEEGTLRLPASPGLGIDVDPSALDRWATADWRDARR